MSMRMESLKPVADTHKYNTNGCICTKYVCVCEFRWCGPERMLLAVELSDVLN